MAAGVRERNGGFGERDDIRRELARHSPPLADLYAAAVRLVADVSFPGREQLVAHAVREIGNALPEIVLGIRAARSSDGLLDGLTREWDREFDATATVESPSGDRAGPVPPAGTVSVPTRLFTKLDRYFRDRATSVTRTGAAEMLFEWTDPLNRMQKATLAPILREWLTETSWFVRLVHLPRTRLGQVDRETDAGLGKELQRRFERFEAALRGLLGGFFKVQKKIEDIVESRGPDGLDELLPLLSVAEQRRQFFNSLNDPAWLRPLEAKGFFAKPEQLVPDSPTGETIHPVWPALRYLLRMASRPEAQEDVARIAAGLPDADNLSVNADLADIALALPPALAVPLAAKASGWLRSARTHGLPQHLGKLATHFARGGHGEPALKLLGALLEFNPPMEEEERWPPRVNTLVGIAELHHILRKHLPSLVDAEPLDVVKRLSQRLDAVLEALHRADDEKGEDHLEVWQHDVRQDRHADSRFHVLLVCALRDAMVQAGEKERVGIAPVLATVEGRGWRVFTRLAMHLLERFAARAPADVGRYLLDRGHFDVLDAEYQRLLQRGFPLLDPAQRDELLRWIDEGPAGDTLRRGIECTEGHEPSGDEMARAADAWRWRRLGFIHAELPESWGARWSRLRGAYGEPATPGADRAQIRVGQVSFESPLTAARLQSMSVGEQVAYFHKWRPPEDKPFVTLEGLRGVLSGVVAGEPARYANEAGLFVGLPPPIVRAVVAGLAAACEAQRVFPWEPVLDLARWVAAQPAHEPQPSPPWHEDQEWAWTRLAVASLLSSGFGPRAGAARVPRELRPKAWEVLATLVSGPPSVKEQVIETVVDYAYWVRSSGPTTAPLGGDLPEVSELLAGEISAEASPKLHRVFGRLLPWLMALDPEWVSAHRAAIFPSEPGRGASWRDAWAGYVTSPEGRPHRSFAILRPEYERAVEETGEPEKPEDRRYPDECLAWHLVVLYLWGDIDLAGSNGILGRFFEVAELPLRKHVFWLAAKELEEALKLGPQVLDRLVALWHDRIAKAEMDARVRDELPAVGWWFATGRFDESWILDQLETVLNVNGRIESAQEVVRRLADLAPERPRVAARLMKMLAPGPAEALDGLVWIDDARRILVEAVRSGDPEAYSDAMAARDQLGKLGFVEVKQLLPLSQGLDDPQAIPYFLWDQPMTVAQFREQLAKASSPERERLLAKLMREARDTDVWKFTTPAEVDVLWPRLVDKLGRKRSFWESLLGQWREMGLLAG